MKKEMLADKKLEEQVLKLKDLCDYLKDGVYLQFDGENIKNVCVLKKKSNNALKWNQSAIWRNKRKYYKRKIIWKYKEKYKNDIVKKKKILFQNIRKGFFYHLFKNLVYDNVQTRKYLTCWVLANFKKEGG